MKEQLVDIIQSALDRLATSGKLVPETQVKVLVERTRSPEHGDLASNVAMMLAKPCKMKPRDIAGLLVEELQGQPGIEKVEIAGPGFINFFLASDQQFQVIETILQQKEGFGLGDAGKGKTIQVEFVSANPTGPLHVGHGRGAAYGSSVSNLLEAVGYKVDREYYVNDAGRQMDILAASVWVRYLEAVGVDVWFPSKGYKGEYIYEFGEQLKQQYGERFRFSQDEVLEGVVEDVVTIDDTLEDGEKAVLDHQRENHIDGLIANCKKLLGDDYALVFNHGLESIRSDIEKDLHEFGIDYQTWFSEKSLADDGTIEKAISRLKENGHVYEKGGALWFKSTAFGDDKDRVVQRDNGLTTYFASDIAYHLNKYERGFSHVINVWGADHHGYIARVKAALQALDVDPEWLTVILVQFASLFRGGEKVQMSTRSGSFVTLRELRQEVGDDAARFFYVLRKSEQHMDFDLDLAKSESKDNPVYYVQYAHARCCSLAQKASSEAGFEGFGDGLPDLALLNNEHESALLKELQKYPEVLERAAVNYEPHQLSHYLRDLAAEFHSWYNAHKVIGEAQELMLARLALSEAVRQVLSNGLQLIGVSAPENM